MTVTRKVRSGGILHELPAGGIHKSELTIDGTRYVELTDGRIVIVKPPKRLVWTATKFVEV